jgi:hypothetical protein
MDMNLLDLKPSFSLRLDSAAEYYSDIRTALSEEIAQN